MIFKYILAVLPAALAADIFVSPDGSSSGSGSSGSPYLDIQDAVDAASAGDTIYLRGGTYRPTSNIHFTKKGSSSNPYTISSYEDEEVIVDGDDLPGTPVEYGGSLPGSDRGVFHFEGAEYWRVIHITLRKGPYGLYVKDSHNNFFSRITTAENYETGFHMQNDISNNEIAYLDSYRNADPRNNGKNSDGFAIKEGSGEGNVIYGARIYENSDDGIDLYEFTSSVTISDSVVWGNGYNRWDFNPHENDGHGVKLGGGSTSNRAPVNHVVTNVISFENFRRGFTDNNMPGDMTLTQNTAWKNAEEGFNQRSSSATYEGNLAAGNFDTTSQSDQNRLEDVSGSGNSWDDVESFSDSDFISTDRTLVQGPRGSDGRIAASDFLRPASGASYGATTEWA